MANEEKTYKPFMRYYWFLFALIVVVPQLYVVVLDFLSQMIVWPFHILTLVLLFPAINLVKYAKKLKIVINENEIIYYGEASPRYFRIKDIKNLRMVPNIFFKKNSVNCGVQFEYYDDLIRTDRLFTLSNFVNGLDIFESIVRGGGQIKKRVEKPVEVKVEEKVEKTTETRVEPKDVAAEPKKDA